jgi:hypothetical protein
LQDSTFPMTPPPPLPLPGPVAEAEQIRQELLEHEGELRFFGLFYLFGGIVGAIAAVSMSIALALGQLGTSELGPAPWIVMLAIFGVGSLLYLWLGIGLIRLDYRVRLLAILMAAVGLLGFPVGTLINGYFLYLLLSEKGRRVLSPEYRAVIAATQHLRRKAPWLLGCVLIVVVVGGLAALAVYLSG